MSGAVAPLSQDEESRILEMAEIYVNAEKGSPGAYACFELTRYLKELREKRLKKRRDP